MTKTEKAIQQSINRNIVECKDNTRAKLAKMGISVLIETLWNVKTQPFTMVEQ